MNSLVNIETKGPIDQNNQLNQDLEECINDQGENYYNNEDSVERNDDQNDNN